MLTPHSYQAASIDHLLKVLPAIGAAVDASDTGVGKTLVGVEVMKRLDLPTLVVCPKAVMPGWQRTAVMQGTELDTLNYEMLRTGRTAYGEWRPRDLYHAGPWFRWNPAIKFLIFDEVQRCKGNNTSHSQLLKAARKQNILTLGLSATMADTPMEMDALGYLLRLHDSDSPPTIRTPVPVHFLEWARQYGVNGIPPVFNGSNADMLRLNAALFPSRGVRVRVEDLGSLFPETQITAELYDIDEPERANAIYADMAEALERLKQRTEEYCMSDPMVQMLAERQAIELLKVPVFVELAKDAIAQGMSVAAFVNFRATLDEICARMKSNCRIDGSQVGPKGAALREANRVAFQSDQSRFIGVIGEAGGVGLDLHDITGKHARLSLISPGFNAKLLRQIFGRVHRVGGKSKSLQRVILAAGTVEEGIHRCLSGKLDRLDALQDADLTPENLRLN